MSDLLTRIANLTKDAIDSEAKILNLYFELNKAYEEIGDEKFDDVVGIHRPNLHAFMIDTTNHIEILSNNKFVVESSIDKKAEKARKKLEEEWEELVKKIPQKDEYYLEGIKTWHVSQYTMVPDGVSIREPLFKEEMIKLVAAGFRLAINDNFGTGNIRVEDNGFAIELWQWNKQKIIHKNTIDEVIIWLTNFFEKQIV